MRWTLKPDPDPSVVAHLAEVLKIDPLLSKLLVQRGIQTSDQANRFFHPSLNDLHDPFLMKDMQKAVDRLESAFKKGERILVFGDYDVDGTTAVALFSSYLKTIYSEVDTYIPDRYDEGYGISFKGIDYAEDNGITLIVALDCGIKSMDKIDYAHDKGIDFIICDHHLPGDTVPNAIAVLDPKQKDCNYPYDELCGCGVGFKLVQALAQTKGQTIDELIPYLDLVATAIGADIVPITGENRILAYYGLKVINSNPRYGIKALLQEYKQTRFTISDIVFKVAPKINAAGRIKHGNYAVALLTKFTMGEAEIAAKEIIEFNSFRRDLDKEITDEALKQIEINNEIDKKTTVVCDDNWHKGVIGIVASRLIETYYRPTLVFTKSGDNLAASARSVKNFDVYKALEVCSEYMIQFGGHMYAAGLTIKEENYPYFKEQFEKVVAESITDKDLIPEIEIDAMVSFTDFSDAFIEKLKDFEPYGPGNMTPVFLTRNVYDTGYAKNLGQRQEHLKMFVKQEPAGIGFAAIAFGMGNCINKLRERALIDLAYSLEENEWNGKTSIQLQVKDIRSSRV